MQSVAGQIRAGEAQKTAKVVAGRLGGRASYFYLVMVGLMVVGGVLGYALGLVLGRVLYPLTCPCVIDPVLVMLAGTFVGIVAYVIVCRPLLVRRFRRSMSQRGLATEFHQSLVADHSGLKGAAGGVSKAADWSVVTELFEHSGYWIFLVGMDPWYVPRRHFATLESELSFIRECLEHMSEPARGRSPDAVSFAGS